MKCPTCTNVIDISKIPGLAINRSATIRSKIVVLLDTAKKLTLKREDVSHVLHEIETLNKELDDLTKPPPKVDWSASYWAPGSYVYEQYVSDALKRRTLIEFTCKLCGKKHRTAHKPYRPSETPLPVTITTEKDSKGAYFFRCVDCNA